MTITGRLMQMGQMDTEQPLYGVLVINSEVYFKAQKTLRRTHNSASTRGLLLLDEILKTLCSSCCISDI